jgi:hypothetical protein
LVCTSRKDGRFAWGGESYCGGYYEFTPPINPSKVRWVEEEIRITKDEFRLWHDGSIDALGGFCNNPIDGVDTWRIAGYREFTQDIYIDDFWITVYSRPPDTPPRPSGPSHGDFGKKLTYTIYTYDPDDDPVFFMWEWGDGSTSDWIGPSNSGDMSTASHIWSSTGNFSVRVKAKDTYEYESDWSDPIYVVIPRNRAWFNFIDLFPLIQKILNLF